MREIKFRAWDIKPLEGRPKMIYGIDKIKEFYEGIELIDELLNPEKAGIPEVKIMQFTGLKDKNGKEIFEGDIVEVPDHHQEDILWEAYIGKIYYSDGAWLIELSDESLCEDINEEDLYLKAGRRNIKVIGNTYENPELLTHKEDKK